jgi:molybdenum cofactor cytidylyltransferase
MTGMTSNPKIAAILLAAGASTRMGRPKQLLPFRGRSLLVHAAETAIASGCHPIIVVLGAYLDRIRGDLETLPVHVAENPDWETGMGSSVRTGIQSLMAAAPDIEAAILLLCDRPFVSVRSIHRLVAAYRSTDRPIVASGYNETIGVPALFHQTLFPELLRLQGMQGAKSVIERYPAQIVPIEFPQEAIDLDTPEDYSRILPNPIDPHRSEI